MDLPGPEGKESKKQSYLEQGVITLYLVLAFFAIPHLIDDFLFGIPAEFGLSVQLTQFLAGIFIVSYLAILIPLARHKRVGIYGAMIMGIFLALAGILKHIPLMVRPGPYWSGWFSEVLIIGLILAGLACSLTAAWALLENKGAGEPEEKEFQ